MSGTNIIDLWARRQRDDIDGTFLQLIDDDIRRNPEAIQAIPSALLARMRTLVERAEEIEHSELLQG